MKLTDLIVEPWHDENGSTRLKIYRAHGEQCIGVFHLRQHAEPHFERTFHEPSSKETDQLSYVLNELIKEARGEIDPDSDPSTGS